MTSLQHFIQFLLIFLNPNISMKKVISQQEKQVYKFTNPTYMKFVPLKDFEAPSERQNTTFFNGIKRFFSQLMTSKSIEDVKATSKKQGGRAEESKVQKKEKNKLQYVKRMTNEDFLVGNEDQLDGISVVGVIDGFVDTMHLWSINLNKAIHHVIIDPKKNYIIVLPKGEMFIYQFKPKNMEEKPEIVASLKIADDVKFVQILKDSSFALFYPKGFQVFSVVEELKTIKSTLKKMYDIKNPNLRLFQIPQPFQNILNIFFEDLTDKKLIFSIWNIEIQFLPKEVRMSKVSKVYEFPYEMRKVVTMQNYSKEIYFINLGEQIIAIKKGYILDSARVNKNTNDCHLKFFAQSRLLHISTAKLEIYKFLLNANTIPAKISLQSTDSAEIPFADQAFEYLQAIQLNGDNYGIFYQQKEKYNRSMHGQIKYAFVLTHQIKLEEKIQNILPMSVKDVNIEKIEEKADMATKMGLQRKNIYLRLWNSSAKCEVQDYQLLLDTLDYETIKSEIEKKLKKNSMNYRQLILIEQGCLSMLSANVFKENNTKQHIKNYMISHLLIRKLQFYKQISMIEKSQGKKISQGQGGKLLINIQNYNHFKTVDIKSMLIEFISQFCNEDKDHVLKIRAIFKHFRFSLRIIYLDILAEVVAVTKKKFLKVLQQIPEILPYSVELEDGASPLEGIWNEVTQEQWEKSLYIDTLVTIQNKENIEEICESVWFKRNWLTQQDYINFSRPQIQEIQQKNCSDTPFYRTIDKVFQIIKDYPTLRTIIDFIQDKYIKLPNHILGKIFLYNKLYEHFKANQKLIQIDEEKIGLFSQFLKWKDPQIFKAMFNYQKLKKGFILKEMKPLYAKLSSAQTFTEGLLNYFASPFSQISDIKYLLNRMNNEKRQFHEQNEGLYEVLVRGMQLKLKIGGDSDIPADEVLIYIENIPLPQKNPVFKDLQTMRSINKESQRFKRMKLNMSIFQITKNMDAVIAAVISRQVLHAEILKTRDFEAIRQISYKIIDDAQSLKASLYENSQDSDIVAFIYLTKLLEEEQMIQVVGKLIQDTWFSRFNFDQIKIENMVLFMYKWKLNAEPSYVNSANYLKKLIQLLPQTNNCRLFIDAEIEIGIMLSTSENHVSYPLNNCQQYFSSVQLEKKLGSASGVHLLQIDIEKLFHYVSIVQKIALDKNEPETTLKMLYEIIVIRLMDCNLLVQLFPKIRQLMEMAGAESRNNFIYPCLIISKLAPELVEENKIILLECAAYLFKNPLKLLEILEQLISLVSTTSEQKAFLLNTLQICKSDNNLTYEPQNPIFERLYTSSATSQAQQQNLMSIQKLHIRFLTKIKQEFSIAHFYNSFIILCNDPYVLPVYLYSIRYEINFRDFRAFISFLVKQQLFNKRNTIQLTRRMFIVIFEAIKYGKGIEVLVDQLKKVSLDENKDFQKNVETNSALQKVILESIERMKSKGKIIANEQEKKLAKGLIQSNDDKQKRIKERLNTAPVEASNKQYPFVDSDDNSNKPYPKIKRAVLQTQKTICEFDPSYERSILLARNMKSLRIYLSSQLQKQLKSRYNLMREIRNNIFYNLSIDRDKAKIEKSSDQINDAIRNSIRRSRSNKGDNQPSQPSSEGGQPFLFVKPPTPLPQKQSAIVQPQYKEAILYSHPQADIKVQILQEVQPIKRQSQGKVVEFIEEVQDNEPKNYLQPDELRNIQAPLGIESGRVQEELLDESRPLQENEIKQEENDPIVAAEEKEAEGSETPYLKLQTLQSHKQEQLKNEVPDIGNSEAQLRIISTILNNQILKEQTQYDFSIIDKYSHHEHFCDFLEELVHNIYEKFDITLQEIILFIRALSNAYPKFHINKIFLDIYEKADKLQLKFNLDLPLKSLLGPEGLFIQGENTEILFKYLLPRIINLLNEEQLLKACKVITLSFKKSELEQEIMFKYVLGLLSRYEQCFSNTMIASREKGMLREKIEVILGKIPVKLLKKKQEQLYNSVSDNTVRVQAFKMIVNSCKARYDVKISQYFESKYLSK